MGKVLIIDDEPAIGDYLKRLISGLGHQAVAVLSAECALSEIEGGGYDLIVADICLPDAPTPFEWIRRLGEKAGRTPLVLISGAPSPELAELAARHGVISFLSKPFEMAFVKNILKTVCGS